MRLFKVIPLPFVGPAFGTNTARLTTPLSDRPADRTAWKITQLAVKGAAFAFTPGAVTSVAANLTVQGFVVASAELVLVDSTNPSVQFFEGGANLASEIEIAALDQNINLEFVVGVTPPADIIGALAVGAQLLVGGTINPAPAGF